MYMICALASLGFINENIEYNKNKIIETLIDCKNKADIVLFGEAFLQGFYSVTFDNYHDLKIAITRDDLIIKEIQEVCKQNCIAVSFGFIEKEKDCFYSSQITIDANGKIIDLFHRVSSGWKEPFANEKYLEGNGFHLFNFKNQKVSIGLCGDLWFDHHVELINQINPNIVFWPVYTDFNYEEWNTSIKYEYALQAKRISEKVLYVNSYCLDKVEIEYAKGGAAMFIDGRIIAEVPAGREEILFIEV